MNIANIATFYWYCKNAGLQTTSERTQKIRKLTITGKAAGLRKEQIIENLKKFEQITEAEQIVEEVFDSGSDSAGDTLIDQLEMYLGNNYIFKRNDITRYIERFPERVELYQKDFNTIFIAAKKVLKGVDYQLFDRLINSDFIPTYNPLREYFDSLGYTKRDDSPLIDSLTSTIKTDAAGYCTYFVKKWIVSVISSAFGVHSPLVLVLCGKQNTGKTEWLRRLLPQEINDFYAESKLDTDIGAEQLMIKKLIISDDEFAGKSKQQSERFKELTSKQIFSFRPPYGRSPEDFTRLAVLCGTSNDIEILSDPTGNRRIIPITVLDVDKKLYNSIDKREMWKEAYQLFKSGFEWRVITKEDIEFLNSNSVKHETLSNEGELILEYFAPSDSNEWMSASIIQKELTRLTNNHKMYLDRISKQLKKMGFPQRAIVDEESGKEIKKWGVKKKYQQPEYVPPDYSKTF